MGFGSGAGSGAGSDFGSGAGSDLGSGAGSFFGYTFGLAAVFLTVYFFLDAFAFFSANSAFSSSVFSAWSASPSS